MTVNGTITTIIAALAGLTFTPLPSFSGAANLQIVTDDQGNSGIGRARSDTDSVPITVQHVNRAPVNTVPGDQTMTAGTTRVFSAADGNPISISDADAGTAPVQVTLTATNGTATLQTMAGLT